MSAGRTQVPAALAAAVADVAPDDLLPTGRDGAVRGPVRLLAAFHLGGGRWAAVVRTGDGALLGVPLRQADGARPRRARPGDGVAEALLAALAAAREAQRDDDAGWRLTALHPCRAAGERATDVDQTHESVVVGTPPDPAAVVKWGLHLTPPRAARLLRHLDAVGFRDVPRPLGSLTWRDPGSGAEVLVALAAELLPAAQDGWDWCVDDLLEHLVDPSAGRLRLDAAVAPVGTLGALVARLHRALATPSPVLPVPVAPAGPDAGARWHAAALRALADALALTDGAPGERLAARAGRVRAALAPLASTPPGTRVQQVHGDLHVGQVLRWGGGYAVTDFDGNPVLPATGRDEPQPTERDVAGMLRSLDHVGRIADRRTEGARREEVERWIAAARTAFLAAYDLPVDPGLLQAFEVEQELREHVYAARHLPRWQYVPDAALGALLDGHSYDPSET
ncbi:MAG TPA: hypothetical protein VFS29_01605 [Motilibacteraceae bacterium]|nr:hypothetical protein [Motilibacteraceae bacterium]